MLKHVLANVSCFCFFDIYTTRFHYPTYLRFLQTSINFGHSTWTWHPLFKTLMVRKDLLHLEITNGPWEYHIAWRDKFFFVFIFIFLFFHFKFFVFFYFKFFGGTKLWHFARHVILVGTCRWTLSSTHLDGLRYCWRKSSVSQIAFPSGTFYWVILKVHRC